MKSLCTTLLTAAALAGLTLPAMAGGGSFVANFGALAVGKITSLTPTHLFWAGAFSGVLSDPANGPMNHAQVTCPSTNDMDLKGGKGVIAGYCLISNGSDSIVAKFTCSGAPGSCNGTAEWSDGAGKWQGWTADVKFTGQLGKALEDGSVPTYAVWNVTYKTP